MCAGSSVEGVSVAVKLPKGGSICARPHRMARGTEGSLRRRGVRYPLDQVRACAHPGIDKALNDDGWRPA